MAKIDDWLTQHPFIAQRMIWQLPHAKGGLQWANWPESNKQKLRDCFAAYWDWNKTLWDWYDVWSNSGFTDSPVGFNPSPSTTLDADPTPVLDPPINIQLSAPGGSFETVIDSAAAFDLYVRYVTMTLAVEIGQHVNWSLSDYDAKGLLELLDGTRMFSWINSGNSYWWGVINESGYRVNGMVIPAPPMISTSFLALNGLVAPTRRETIERLLDWCRANLNHIVDGTIQSGKTLHDVYYQYNGATPVSRVINGTVMSEAVGSFIDSQVQHWTSGCSDTSPFLREVLRAINIPVRVVAPPAGHFMPHFMSENLYLSHGDDPYALPDSGQHGATAHEIPISKLPIDAATFDSWLVHHPSPHNVGRRVSELTIEYLPVKLLQDYCWDMAHGYDHASGRVYNFYFEGGHYTLHELETHLQLWQKMDAKIDKLGGCSKL